LLALVEIREGVNDFAAQILRRLEFPASAVFSRPFFQFGKFLLRVLVRLNHFDGERVVFVNDENENWNPPLDGAIELHLSNRDVVAFGFVSVAPGEDADINVRTIDHFERDSDAVRVAGRHSVIARHCDLGAVADVERVVAATLGGDSDSPFQQSILQLFELGLAVGLAARA